MQFKVGNYRDGDWESNIRMLTGTIKVDWIQLPVERYLAALPTLRHGVTAGVLRKKYDVQSMWGDMDPQWRLLQSQIETKGPGWYSPAEREERLFTNKPNRPGDDMKEALRTDGDTAAWQAWSITLNQIWHQRRPAPPLVFPGEQQLFLDMYTQVREEEQIISIPYTRSPEEIPRRGRKKRKQGEDSALLG